jgi:hypothetical protein
MPILKSKVFNLRGDMQINKLYGIKPDANKLNQSEGDSIALERFDKMSEAIDSSKDLTNLPLNESN